MLKIGLVLTNDWELFGNGKGDFHSIQYEPTKKLLDVCEQYGAKLTLMAEVGKQWAHEKLGESQPWAENIAQLWKNQARDTIVRGHDVQLHLHPQWVRASHNGRNWILDYEHYSLTSFSIYDSVDLISSGKKYLENLFSDIDDRYECFAFRAGNFMVDPSDDYVRCIIESGIKCDTTVSKGRYLNNNLGSYNFQKAESNFWPWWISRKSLNRACRKRRELIEFPILSEPYTEFPAGRHVWAKIFNTGGQAKLLRRGPIFRIAREQFGINAASFTRHRDTMEKRQARYPGGGLPVGRSFYQKMTRYSDLFWRRSSMMLDYDNLIPEIAAAMVVNIYDKLAKQQSHEYVPVVAIGHVKNMINTDYLDKFLGLVLSALGKKIVFQTLSEAHAMWINNCAPCRPA